MTICKICPNHCCLEKKSICGRSRNVDENVVETTGIAVDPIEKKPLYHFMPGSKTLSVGGLGCNLKCLNCQNHEIAQPVNPGLVPTEKVTPEEIVNYAMKNNLPSISWTYNEPTIHPEWIISTAKIAQEYDIKTILVTNGYTSQETLGELEEYIDAVNVDLKSMNDDFYINVCKARVDSVKNSIEFYYDNGIHTEVTTLLIPGYNDSIDEISSVCEYIHGISKYMVLHFSLFVPRFKLSHLNYTKEEVVLGACRTGHDSGLKYVYPGNTYPSHYDNTYCDCGELLIKRDVSSVFSFVNGDYRCSSCNSFIEGFKF